MSEDLLRKLQGLEEDYFGQPFFLREADLREINQIRSQLGRPLVDAHLKEIAAAVEAAPPQQQPEAVSNHTEARQIYHGYLKKMEELEPHRVYAERVAQATAGDGQTPVRPLATMGTNDGPLLCDHCGKPIILEGGRFHGVDADVAWKQQSSSNWSSWILGGMVVEIQTNGTLRIYHGYPGRHSDCCNVANREHEKAREEFESRKGPDKSDMILAFLEQEFPEISAEKRLDLLLKIFTMMYTYDPGVGINRPGKQAVEGA